MAKSELNLNIAEIGDKELVVFRNELLMKQSEIEEAYAEDIAEISKGDDFDPYSRKGERQIKKIAKKYQDITTGVDYLLEVVNTELAKRDKYNEEQRYSGKSSFAYEKQSESDFLKAEELKTMSHKAKLDE